MNKTWLKQYPNSLDANLEELDNDSITDLLDSASYKFSNNIAFSSLNTDLSYKMLNLLSKRLAAYMQYLGISKHTRVAIMLPNLLTYPVSLFATYFCGGTVININPLYKTREIEHVLKDSDAEYIFVLDKFYNELEPCIDNSKLKGVIVCKITDLLSPLMKLLVSGVMLYKRERIKIKRKKDIIYFSDIISNNFSYTDVQTDLDDTALLQYTGGTTGKSKAALLTHRNLLSNIQQVHNWIKPHITEGKEIIITALPLYHIFSFTVNCLTFLKIGSENVLIANPRDLKSFLKVLEKKKFTVLTGVNTLFNLLMTSSRFKKINFNNFKVTVGGGMAVLSETAKKWKKITGTNITQGYGLTETSPVVTINKIDDSYNGSIGIPLQSTDVKIIDENGNKLQVGQEGELCVKGPQVMSGYLNDSSNKSQNFTSDNYFKTGDIAVINTDGFLKIVDRKKDMIISSGYNVYPNEVEDFLGSHEDVIEAGVIGVNDKNRGEAIKAFIVSSNNKLTAQEIISYCKAGLTEYKVPKSVVFLDELPKTNVGKILRRELRNL
ncbi:MAG: AMP-binding protein [Gammaproteobacteria bacterium]|tara:strand:- start:4953 stop:6602 length:1650 start_codon:yes stop_codon:yes gene_type:complete